MTWTHNILHLGGIASIAVGGKPMSNPIPTSISFTENMRQSDAATRETPNNTCVSMGVDKTPSTFSSQTRSPPCRNWEWCPVRHIIVFLKHEAVTKLESLSQTWVNWVYGLRVHLDSDNMVSSTLNWHLMFASPEARIGRKGACLWWHSERSTSGTEHPPDIITQHGVVRAGNTQWAIWLPPLFINNTLVNTETSPHKGRVGPIKGHQLDTEEEEGQGKQLLQ